MNWSDVAEVEGQSEPQIVLTVVVLSVFFCSVVFFFRVMLLVHIYQKNKKIKFNKRKSILV